MIILGLSGKKQAGKDTVAGIISRARPGECHVLPFAGKLYEELAVAIRAINPSFMIKTIPQMVEYIKANKTAFRLMLQGLGTDYRRTLHGTDYWIKKWTEQCSFIPEGCNFLIATDVRFRNEYEAVKKYGGYVWRVYRTDYDSHTDSHASENDLDFATFDRTLHNGGSIAHLEEQVLHALEMTVKEHNTKLCKTQP